MGKIGKISVIKRDFSGQQQTMQSELNKKGYTRMPGTGAFKFPYKEIDGKYRTGLDPDAAYIRRIQDPVEKQLEIERVTETRDRLQLALGIDLSPRSDFWKYSLSASNEDASHVQPVKLIDGDNYFDQSVPNQELAFSWLRVHPTIASSYQAWERGEYPAETQFYVVDSEIESKILFNKKTKINKAIVAFTQMEPSKRKKVARLLGLPVSEDTVEEVVYNEVDNLLKQTEFKKGKYQGLEPVEIFTRFSTMKDSLLNVKDIVQQALDHQVYREKANSKIYEKDVEIAKSQDELVQYLMDDDNQEELILLQGKIKGKKLAAV